MTLMTTSSENNTLGRPTLVKRKHLKVLRNAQNLAEHGHLRAICFIVLCITPPNIRPMPAILKARAVLSFLRPVPSLPWKISKYHWTDKNPPSLVQIYFTTLYISQPLNFDEPTDTWNPSTVRVVTSFIMEIVKVLWNSQLLAVHSHFKKGSAP